MSKESRKYEEAQKSKGNTGESINEQRVSKTERKHEQATKGGKGGGKTQGAVSTAIGELGRKKRQRAGARPRTTEEWDMVRHTSFG